MHFKLIPFNDSVLIQPTSKGNFVALAEATRGCGLSWIDSAPMPALVIPPERRRQLDMWVDKLSASGFEFQTVFVTESLAEPSLGLSIRVITKYDPNPPGEKGFAEFIAKMRRLSKPEPVPVAEIMAKVPGGGWRDAQEN